MEFPSKYYLGGTQTAHYTEGIGDQAQDLICYLPWWHEEMYYYGGLYSQVVATTKATVFGVYFDGSTSDGSPAQNYMRGESGAFEDVIAAAEEIRKKVKTTGKLFLVGHSSGATAAINFTLAHPDLVDGVAALAPKPDIYPEETTTVPMLLAMNVRDWGIEKQIQTFISTMKESQNSISVITFPMEWGGSPHRERPLPAHEHSSHPAAHWTVDRRGRGSPSEVQGSVAADVQVALRRSS